MSQIKLGIIPAAGPGLRTMYLGKVIPKCLLPVYDRPILHYIVSSMVYAGVEEIRIVTWYKEKMIQDYVQGILWPEFDQKASIYTVHQDVLNGDGGAVICALRDYKDPVFVVLGDDISCPNPLTSMATIIRTKKAIAVEGIIAEPSWEKIKNACSVDIRDGYIVNITEKPTTQEDISWIRGCGVYALQPEAIMRTPKSSDGKCWMSAIIKHNIPTNKVYHCILETNININTPDDLLEASIFFKEKTRNECSNTSC